MTRYSKSKSLLIYTDWLFSIHTYIYLIIVDGNRFNARKTSYRLVRRSQQMHPRDSRYSSRFFVTQPALSATRPTIDPTKSFPSHFLPSSHCHSLLPSFSFLLFLTPSLSIFFSRDFPSTSP